MRIKLLLSTLVVAMSCTQAQEAPTLEQIETDIRARIDRRQDVDDAAFRYVQTAVRGRRSMDARAFCSTYLLELIKQSRGTNISRTEVRQQAAIAEIYRFFQIFRDANMNWKRHKDLLDWVTGDAERYCSFVRLPGRHDKLPRFVTILNQLCTSDPKDRDQFAKLIFAIALVWDTARPQLHHYAKLGKLPYKPELPARYAHFRDLQKSGKAKLDIAKLTVQDLLFVVDTPVPVSELKWAVKQVDKNLHEWDEVFADVRFHAGRWAHRQIEWTGGPYSLARIQTIGGIPVDRAHFCTIAGRSWCIPSIFTLGVGSSNTNAWVAYMRKPGIWQFDIGRDFERRGACGISRNPQTNQFMTRHEFEFYSERKYAGKDARQFRDLLLIANAMFELEKSEVALALAERAREMDPLRKEPWLILQDYHRQQKDTKALLKNLHEQAEVFEDEHHYLPDIYVRIGRIYIDGGKPKEAIELVDDLRRELPDERYDRELNLAIRLYNILISKKLHKPALGMLEDVMTEHRREGSRPMSLVPRYLETAKAAEETGRATRFLNPLLSRVARAVDDEDEPAIMVWLYRAYLNDNDARNAERIRRKYDLPRE